MRWAVIAAVLGLAVSACGETVEIEPPPGNQWFRDGEPVSDDVVAVELGPAACGWENVGFLEVTWPLTPAEGEETERRQYVRNVDDSVPAERLLAPYDGGSSLPRGARYTGLHTASFQLWFGPDSDQWAYIVAGPTVEAWPRADPPLECE